MINDNSVTVYQSNGDIFKYLMRIVSKDGKAYPHATLTRMQILDQQENSENISEIPTSAASTDHTRFSLNLNEMSSACDLVDSALRNYFGFASFIPQQRETILAMLFEKKVLAILFTSGGKSLTFMLPAVISSKITIVISPVVSLVDLSF